MFLTLLSFAFIITVLVFIIYLAISAIKKGLKAKKSNIPNNYENENSELSDNNLSDKLVKLNELFTGSKTDN